ncbi:hypothetical protein ABPG75_010484 [Micractinium tetrahymenae]
MEAASTPAMFIGQLGARLAAAARHAARPLAPQTLGWLPARSGATTLQRWSRAPYVTAVAASGGDGRLPEAAAAAEQHRQALAPPTPPPSQGQHQEPPHLRQLSEEQLAAVTAPLGTVRVVAGPGSGKTRVLTSRIAHLIRAHGAQPYQILAITFTNKAANEMKERLAAILGEEAGKELFAGTFHGLCYRILKRHIADLQGTGRDAAFTIYDQDMSTRVLARLVRAANPDWGGRAANSKADELQDAISKAKSRMLTWHADTPRGVADAIQQHAIMQLEDQPTAGELARWQELGDYVEQYERAMRDSNAVDFDDLLGLAVALLRGNEAVHRRYLRRFRHVLVDEFQDTNATQYELVKLLTLPRGDLFIVGDPDQSIYSFRGADMTNMTQALRKDFPEAQIYALRDNYRSCARIVATAERVIEQNDDWQRAGLRPRLPAGHPIEVHVLEDSHAEAEHIAKEIKDLLRRGEHPEEQVAVLMRTRMQARLLEQQLVLHKIPYVMVGGVPFWRRVEVQDVMAYLRLAVGLRDDVALTRIINTPKRSVGDTSVKKLRAHAAERDLSLCALLFGRPPAGSGATSSAAASLPPLPDRKELGLTPQAAAALQAFRELVLGLHESVGSRPLAEAIEDIIAKTGYEQHVKEGGCSSMKKGEQQHGEHADRLMRLEQLVAVAEEYVPGSLSGAGAFDADFDVAGSEDGSDSGGSSRTSGIDEDAEVTRHPCGSPPPDYTYAPDYSLHLQHAQNFLDEAALYSSADEGGQGARGVRVMTMHAAKGLEFEAVFVPGLNDGLVPLLRPDDDRRDALSEERRLFYVSLTRAKQRLRLSHTWESTFFGRGR